ncbi:pyocin knob domain-containing protein [Paenibacillus sp. FSL H8-0317]|uniref:pyocin knob domain-containing protein n=1 Tax=Paenibacillus sp. FSL H8-0317 TaxID=2921385 RepID=UPI00324CE775
MLETMYPAAVNSRQTELAEAINDSQTSFTVLDGSVLPPAPNLLSLGTDESAETVLYTGKTGNEITGVTRGFESGAASWAAGTKLSRYFTAHDHDTFRENITDLDQRLSNIPAPQDASLTDKGIVQLSNATDGESEEVAATEKAVNDARVSAISESKLYVDERDWQKHALTQEDGNAKSLPQGFNLNNLKQAGTYIVFGAVNAPVNGVNLIVEVISGTGSYVIQRAMNPLISTPNYYQRHLSGSNWRDWSVDLFTSVSDGKTAVAAAITGKGVAASGSDTFPQLATKIGQIATGLRFVEGTGTTTENFITQRGMAFKPKLIFLSVLSPKPPESGSAWACGFKIYSEYADVGNTLSSMFRFIYGISSANGSPIFQNTDPFTIYNDGFRVGFAVSSTGNTGLTYKYIAIS